MTSNTMHGYPLCLRYVTCRWHQVAARYPHTVLQTLRRISYYRKSFLSSVFSNFPYCKNAVSSFIHDMLNGLNNTIQFIPFMTQSTADKLNKIAISRCKLVVSDVHVVWLCNTHTTICWQRLLLIIADVQSFKASDAISWKLITIY